MLNSAMVIHGEDDNYSTVDISSVNLYTGETSFYKIGASATFIRHKDGNVECLLSTSLPVGVRFEVEIEQATKQLFDGDFLVMVTDGVLEYLCTEKPEETLEGIISEIKTNHPALLAKKILDKVMEFTGGEVGGFRLPVSDSGNAARADGIYNINCAYRAWNPGKG